MVQLFSYLLGPLLKTVYSDEPGTLQERFNAVGKALTGLIIAIAVYSLSLTWLNFGEFLGRIGVAEYVPSLTNPWHLLNLLSIAILLRLVGGRALMNLKELLRPVIVEALGDVVRAEGRAEQAEFTRAWLEEQRRAGKVSFDDDLEIPVLDVKDQGNGHKDKGDE